MPRPPLDHRGAESGCCDFLAVGTAKLPGSDGNACALVSCHPGKPVTQVGKFALLGVRSRVTTATARRERLKTLWSAAGKDTFRIGGYFCGCCIIRTLSEWGEFTALISGLHVQSNSANDGPFGGRTKHVTYKTAL